MAERRMFAKTIIDSDAFLDMSPSTQALYFHLSMRADDDGFLNNPKKVMRMVGSTEDEFKVLLAKKFILGFESGVIVIKHWKIHNYIQKDRYKSTLYQEELSKISTKGNNVYTMDTECVQIGDTGKVRLGKVSLGKSKDNKDTAKPEKKKVVFHDCVKLTEEEHKKLVESFGSIDTQKKIENLNNYLMSTGKRYKSHYHTILSWSRKDNKGTISIPVETEEERQSKKVGVSGRGLTETHETIEGEVVEW